MSKKQTEQAEELARTLSQSVIAATEKLTDAQKCKVWGETIFMVQHHVNAIKPML